MPYTPDVATIYPNIDTVLSNYVISDAIYDAGVINNKLSNHIAAYLALSIIINAASCLLLLLASFAADDYAGGAAACFAAAPSPGLAPLFTCNEKQRTRENQRKPYCPCYYYLLDWRFHLRPAPFPLKWRLYLPAPAMKNKEARKNNRKPKTKALLPMLLYATSPHIYYYLSYVY